MKNILLVFKGVIMIITLTISVIGFAQPLTEIKVDHIRIEHIGPNDKPFPLIVMTTVKIPDLNIYERNIVIQQKLFDTIYKYFDGNKNLKLVGVDAYGTFRVTRAFKADSVVLYSCPLEDSILFFKGLRHIVKDNEGPQSLIESLEQIIHRINGYDKSLD